MDKLSRFSQWLISIIGAGFILFCLVGGSMVLYEVLGCNRRPPQATGSAIVSADQAQKQAADSIRRQIVSLKNVMVLDTGKQHFLISVGRAKLENPETLADTYQSNKNTSRGYDDSSNDLIFYDGLAGTTRPLFGSRVSIRQFELLKKVNGQPVLIYFSDSDTNQDKVLNRSDLEKLGIWFQTWEKPKILSLEGKTIFDDIEHTKNFVIFRVGDDRDRDGNFEQGKEPVVFYRLDFKCLEPSCFELRQIVSDSVLQKLQRVLDGF